MKRIYAKIGAYAFVIFSVGIASSISLIGGLGIEAVRAKLFLVAPLLIAMPALNSLVGDYATLIAAHAGDPEERTRTRGEMLVAMLPSIVLSMLFVVSLSLMLAQHNGYVLAAGFITKFSLFVVGAIVGMVGVMLVVTVLLDRLFIRHKLNPDDVLIPIVTTISDIFMLGLIALAATFLF